MTQHTPGPWTVQQFADEPTMCICAGEGDLRLATLEHQATKEDATLIAAAPELLEALCNMIGLQRTQGVTPEEEEAIMEQAETAIAKAEGRGQQ